MKNAQIWVSAVLYLALGLIIITLILTAGVPLINKITDRNIISQTKNVMFDIDSNIRAVANEGPGAKRYISPIEIKKGELDVQANNDKIVWKSRVKSKIMENNTYFYEGTLSLYLNTTNVEDEYEIILELDYTNTADINLESPFNNPFAGRYSMLVQHNGTYVNENPVIVVRLT